MYYFWGVSLLILLSEFIQHNYLGKNRYMNNYYPYETHDNSLSCLYYKSSLPILKIKTTDPYLKGYIQGYYTHHKIKQLIWRFTPVYYYLKWFKGLDKYIENVTLLPNHKKEIQGLIQGYNIQEPSYNHITYEWALACHLLPDFYCMACSSLVFPIENNMVNNSGNWNNRNNRNRDPSSGFIVGRNMDFCPLGSAGSDSLLVVDQNMCSLTVPGLTGVITGCNKEGLFVSVNVAHNKQYHSAKGVPLMFLAKLYLQKKSVSDVMEAYNTKTVPVTPCASFHLTMVDKSNYACISFKQTVHGEDVVVCSNNNLRNLNPNPHSNSNLGLNHSDSTIQSPLSDYDYDSPSDSSSDTSTSEPSKNKTPLLIFNYTYTQHEQDENTSSSKTRETCVRNYLNSVKNKVFTLEDVFSILSLDDVNVYDTLHSVIYDGLNQTLYISRNNSYAADGEYVGFQFCELWEH